MTHGSLFSGIGGFDLAAEWMGWENVFHCEWNEFGQKILKYYWPNAITYGDITKTDFTIHRGTIDVLSGGFPCQPYSVAGKRKGKDDDRHLWPEMLRAIREIAPPFVVGENVYGLVNWNGGMVFDEVQADLEAEGYEVTAVILPACGQNAPHRRERIWFVAYSHSARLQKKGAKQQTAGAAGSRLGGTFADTNNNGSHGTKDGQSNYKGNDSNKTWTDAIIKFKGCYSQKWDVADSDNERLQLAGRTRDGRTRFEDDNCKDVAYTNGKRNERRCNKTRQEKTKRHFGTCNARIERTNWENFPTQSPICGGDDGLPSQLDGITFSKWRNESIKGYGNAVVPQIPYQIFKAIEQYANSI